MNIFETQIKPHLNSRTPSFGKIDSQTLVEAAEQIGGRLSVDNTKNHQIRKFYDAVKQIERHTLRLQPGDPLPDEHIAQLLFLRPHLANAQRKDSSIRSLREALDPCLVSDVMETKADLTRFVKFFEAIIAYAG